MCCLRVLLTWFSDAHATLAVGRVSGPAPDIFDEIRLSAPRGVRDTIHVYGSSTLERCAGDPLPRPFIRINYRSRL